MSEIISAFGYVAIFCAIMVAGEKIESAIRFQTNVTVCIAEISHGVKCEMPKP